MKIVKIFLTTIAALMFLASPAFAQNTATPTVKEVTVQFPVEQLQKMASCAKSQSKIFDTILSGNIGNPGNSGNKNFTVFVPIDLPIAAPGGRETEGIDRGDCCATVLGGCVSVCDQPGGCTGVGDCIVAP